MDTLKYEPDVAHRKFVDDQRSGLGATDSPKILGLSKHGTANSVYEAKVATEYPEQEASLPAWLGMRMEGTVAELYAQATGHQLRAAKGHYRRKDLEFITCHLDYRRLGDPKVLVECKTRAYMTGWGEDGSQDVPPDIWVQAQHEMYVMDAKQCDIAVLFGHHTFRVYPILRDDEFIPQLAEVLDDFWHKHVLARIPPPPTDADGHLLNRRTPQDDGEILPSATPAQEALVRTLAERTRRLEEAKRLVAEQENLIKAALGEKAGWETSLGRVTWKTTKDITTTDWAAVAKAYRSIIDDNIGYDTGADTIESLHTGVRPGYRRFYYKPPKESE